MKISNWGEDLQVEGLHAEIGPYEHVTIVLPTGHRVDVFSDFINVATPDTHRTKEGRRVWRVTS
jgi:hypothetical protein